MPAMLRRADHPLRSVDGPGVRVLTISNPSKKGAVDRASLQALVREAERATADNVRCLVLTGEGGAFCSGYDLGAIDTAETIRSQGRLAALPDVPLGEASAALEQCAPPILCAIDGAAYGAGLELACACDLRVASRGAKLCAPPARLGIVYAPDGAARVLRLVGLSHARRLFLTADALDAREALRIGLVDELVASGPALPRALVLAEQIASLSPQSTQGMKQLLRAVAAGPLTEGQRADFERLRRRSFESDDAREGLAAFVARRAPVFTGR